MKYIPLAIFAVYTVFLGAKGWIAARDAYIGMAIFMAAEYLECVIESVTRR